MNKQCGKCKKEQDLSCFNKKSSNKDGLQKQCKSCFKEFHQKHYEERKDYYKIKASKHNAKYRIRNLEFMLNYLLDHPCMDCNEYNPMLLEFDHRGDKSYDVSAMSTLSLDLLTSEIAKCDIRCAHCHKMKTAKEREYYKNIRIPVMTLINNIQRLSAQLKSIEEKENNARFYFNNYYREVSSEIASEYTKLNLDFHFSNEDFWHHRSNSIKITLTAKDYNKKYEDQDQYEAEYTWQLDCFKNLQTGTEISFAYSDIKGSSKEIGANIKEAFVTDFSSYLAEQVKSRIGNPAAKIKFESLLRR